MPQLARYLPWSSLRKTTVAMGARAFSVGEPIKATMSGGLPVNVYNAKGKYEKSGGGGASLVFPTVHLLGSSLRKNTVAMGARAFSDGERQGPTADDVRKFTVEGVRQWAVVTVGIDVKHAAKLVAQEIDGEALLEVTKEDLVKFYGMPGGPAMKLMKAINALLNVNTGAPATQRPFQTLSEYL